MGKDRRKQLAFTPCQHPVWISLEPGRLLPVEKGKQRITTVDTYSPHHWGPLQSSKELSPAGSSHSCTGPKEGVDSVLCLLWPKLQFCCDILEWEPLLQYVLLWRQVAMHTSHLWNTPTSFLTIPKPNWCYTIPQGVKLPQNCSICPSQSLLHPASGGLAPRETVP